MGAPTSGRSVSLRTDAHRARAFRRDAAFDIIEAVLHEQPAPRQSSSDTPPELAAIVERALTEDPARRTSTPREIAEEAGRLRARLTGGDRGSSRLPRRRRPRVVTAALAVASIAAAVWAACGIARCRGHAGLGETALPRFSSLPSVKIFQGLSHSPRTRNEFSATIASSRRSGPGFREP